jgi:hypothetical protein
MDIISKLKERGFIPFFARGEDDVLEVLKQNIPPHSEIGFGGSQTVEQLGIPQKLAQEGYVCNHQLTSEIPWNELCVKNRSAKYYITSTNAITEDGILVNTDGRANRISAMCYGSEKLFFVLGKNKICEDLNAAFKRIDEVAAPLNAKRLNKNTPCVKNGKCVKCGVENTICKATLILYHPTSSMQVYVIIVDKELGY